MEYHLFHAIAHSVIFHRGPASKGTSLLSIWFDIVNSQNSHTMFHNAQNEPLWQTLHRRRQDHKITLFYKMFNQLTPVYLSSLIPQQVNAISHHNLRNSNDIHTIRSNTSLYHNPFLPSTLRQWNSLPVDVRQLNTLSSFKLS